MTKTIIDAVSQSGLICPGSSVLCAVSGGADSMCLLHVLFSNREAYGISVYAAHYNHSLRGEESERDCAFVSDYCREHGIPLRVGKGDVAAFADSQAVGIEEADEQIPGQVSLQEVLTEQYPDKKPAAQLPATKELSDTAPMRKEIFFKVYVSRDELAALNKFLKESGITFRQIKEHK